jgi:hypothetical protein
LEKPKRAAVSPRGELKPRQQIDSLRVGTAERAQVANEGSWDRGGHLEIDRPTGQKSSAWQPMNFATQPGLSIRNRSRTTGEETNQ